MKRIFGAILLTLLLCAAKATIGTDFNDANLAKLEIGKTTLQEATALLGTPPAASQVGDSGATAYTWQFIESKARMWSGKLNTTSKLVVLIFNTDGTFQRIHRMQGVTLDAATHQRLFAGPAAEQAAR